MLNLTVHCDEATPGIHLTCIPYSRGCKRGPEVQAALGRAMAGMGYPSTWKDVLDEHGETVLKRDRTGKVIHNADGQGIIDWIEEQKRWIQHKMERRYGWEREYKGSHPRGNLSTPDYQAERAKERLQEIRIAVQEEITNYSKRVRGLTNTLHTEVKSVFDSNNALDMIVQYLKCCPDEQFERILREAGDFLANLSSKENKKAFASLKKKLADIEAQSASKPPAMASRREIEREK